VRLGEPGPGEAPLLEEIRRVFREGTVPSPEWQEVRGRLERKVWRVEGGEGALYVKLQLFRSFRVWFRYALRRAPTEKEGRNALRVLERGIAAPEPLLAGREGALFLKRRSVLVSREVRGVPAARALEEGRIGLEDLARFLAVLASKGVFHRDLHLGNLLAGEGGGLVLLDLQSLSLLPVRVGKKGLLFMAAKLGASLRFQGVGGDREWAEALEGAGLLREGESLGALASARARIQAVERARRVRRCLMNSSAFARENWGRGILFRRRRAEREWVLREARAALAAGKRGWIPGAVEAPCFVDRARRARDLWVDFRRRELEGVEGHLPLALVLERGWGGLGCLVFPPGTSPEDFAGPEDRREVEERVLPGSPRVRGGEGGTGRRPWNH